MVSLQVQHAMNRAGVSVALDAAMYSKRDVKTEIKRREEGERRRGDVKSATIRDDKRTVCKYIETGRPNRGEDMSQGMTPQHGNGQNIKECRLQ